MTTPASPPAKRLRLPSWLDFRLVLGVLLVLISVLVGARIVAASDRSVRVWAVNSDLAAGSLLTADDVRPVRVRLFDNAGHYISTSRSPAGQTLTRHVGKNELLPRDALRPKPCGSMVSIPVSAQHLPATLRKGQRIDVFATAKTGPEPKTEQVLRAATVQLARAPKNGLVSSSAEWSVVVRVRPEEVGAVVRAVRTAEIDIAIVEDRPTAGDSECSEPNAGGPSASPAPSESATPR